MMIAIIVNLLQLILGSAAAVLFLTLALDYKVKKNKIPFMIACAVFVFADLAAALALKDAYELSFVTEILVAVAPMILPCFITKSGKKLTFMWFGLVFFSAFDYFEFIIMLVAGEISFLKEQIIFCIMYALAIIAVLIFNRFSKIRPPENFLESVSPIIYILIFLADYSAYYEVNTSISTEFDTAISNVLRLLSALLIVGGFSVMIYRFTVNAVKQRQAEMRHNLEMEYYEEMMRKNQDIRTFRHDYKNNLLSLNMLLKSKRYDEANEYVEKLSGGIEQTGNKFNSGNYLVDAILSDKAAKCISDGIEIEFSGSFPKNEIDNNTVCTIFSNVVDNAVRACEELAPCKIKIQSDLKPNGVTVKFTNPVKEKVAIKNNSIRTTKSDKENHGIGISNVKKAVKEYDGVAELKCDDKEFEFKVGLIFNK